MQILRRIFLFLGLPCLTAATDQPTDGSKLANIGVRLTLALSTVVCFIGLVYP